MDEHDRAILRHLRNNSRASATEIARSTNSPVTTVFTKIKRLENAEIKRHSTLLDYPKLGYHCQSTIAVKVDKEDRQKMKEFLAVNKNINSAFEINNGYDLMFEAIHKDKKELMTFLDELELCFKIKEKKVFEIISDIKRETFSP